MENIKHVALFEDRHLFPSYVKDSVFPGKQKYHVKDRDFLRTTALSSLTKWKEEGVTSVYVYLSGLNAAVRALEYAAWKLKLYLRIYEYSFTQDLWLPDTIEPFEERLPHPFTQREQELWNKETTLREEFKGREESIHLFYVNVYNDIRLELRDSPNMTWEEIHEKIDKTYFKPCWDLINMMRPYLFPNNNKKQQEGYHEKIRKLIISWRKTGARSLSIPSQRGKVFGSQTTPRDEKPGERLDRLLTKAAKNRPRRRR